jgi:SOS-response transcriptional repressor LexA
MGFQKFQKSESMENVNEEEKKTINDHLAKTSKTSVSEMTEEEKEELNVKLKENNNA